MWKLIRAFFGFALLRLLVAFKTSCHFFSQSEAKPNIIVIRALTFCLALGQLCVFASSFYRFAGVSMSFVIDQSDDFGLVLPEFYDIALLFKKTIKSLRRCSISLRLGPKSRTLLHPT